jgi:hypothetical protein
MAGLVPVIHVLLVGRLNSSWPGLSRPSTSCLSLRGRDVDARHKAGHDGRGIAFQIRHGRACPGHDVSRLPPSLRRLRQLAVERETKLVA